MGFEDDILKGEELTKFLGTDECISSMAWVRKFISRFKKSQYFQHQTLLYNPKEN